jgi:YegS/Rv2252/BmrU family lipid kinase
VKKVKLIYNPISGDRSITRKIDAITAKFQKRGYEVVLHRTFGKGDAANGLEDIDDNYYAIVAAGGDGTVHEVVVGMLKKNIITPLGIIPSGTVNDFAYHLKLPKNVDDCCDIFLQGKTKSVDVGSINDEFFINVACGGLLTSVAQNTEVVLKNTLGKFAYYLKGIEQLPNFRPIHLKITIDGKQIEDDVLLFLVLNGTSAGGFSSIAPDATIDDGMLNFLAVKSCPIHELIKLFIQILKGEHRNNPNMYCIKTKEITLDCEEKIETDVDGEKGPEFPLKIKTVSDALRVFIP